jgi:hypothetical protein
MRGGSDTVVYTGSATVNATPACPPPGSQSTDSFLQGHRPKIFCAGYASSRMDESALQHRLAAIERRQSLALSLLVGVYVLGGTWILVEEVAAVTVWTAGVALVVLAVLGSMIGMYRRRRANA